MVLEIHMHYISRLYSKIMILFEVGFNYFVEHTLKISTIKSHPSLHRDAYRDVRK